MSLLMKALEKAAQDRDKTPAAPPHPPLPPHALQHEYTATPELTLDPVALKPGIKRDENTSRVPMIPKRAAASPADTHPAQARAATVLNAHHTRSDDAAPSRLAGIMAQLAARPVYAISALAALFLLIYAGYVYVQIAHPRLLIKSPVSPQRAPPPAVATTATTTAPPSEPLSGGTPQATDATSASFATLQSVFGGRTDLPAASAALPTSTSPSSSSSTLPRESSGSIPPQPTRPALSPASPPQPDAPGVTPSARIAVSRGDTAAPRVNASVSEAYAALEARQFDTAQRLYTQALRSEPNNVDALLGLAAIAQHDNRDEDAQRYFRAILEVEPRHALAQSGLVALMSRADPQAAESRLKQLLAREPSPPLYFNLGNLYAEQGQWPQAQQAYFQAHNLEPRNPDYAYNLAVGLEHLGQSKLALDFYRKALQLAATKGSANFDSAQIQARITQLTARTN